MVYWPDWIAQHEFTAAEVEEITGVTRTNQRKWLERYFQFDQTHMIYFGGRRPGQGAWTWEGLQIIALFASAMRDLNDAALARRVLMIDPESGVHRDSLDIFHSDQRRLDEENDLVIAADLSALDQMGFGTTTSDNLAILLKGAFGTVGRLYAINFSALQRQLFERAAAVVKQPESEAA